MRLLGTVGTATLVAVFAAPQPAFGQADSVTPTRLARCRAGADVPCVVTTVRLSPSEARREPRDSSAQWWTGRLAGAQLVGTHERIDSTAPVPWKLLIVLDLSGSMRGEGIRYARTGLRAFIKSLPPSVAVGLAPFESRQVAPRIARVRFGPPNDAVTTLDAMPQPDAAGNTALYSAVVASLNRLDEELRSSEPGTRSGLLLLTDGKNDVRGRADDPGLLTGLTGRRTAADVVAKSSHHVWLIGAGNVDREELEALAGRRGEALVDALDAVVLASRFSYIGRQISSDREVTLRVMSPSSALLARGGGAGVLMGGASGDRTDGVALVRQLDWRPPLLALPAYDGVIDPRQAPSELSADATFEAEWSRRIMVGVCLALLWLAATATLPYALATPVLAVPAEGAVEAREAVTPSTTAAARLDERSTGLRADAREAPPRKPDEITASSARRIRQTH